MTTTYIAFVLADLKFTFAAASLSIDDCMKALQVLLEKAADVKAFGCMTGEAKLLWGLK